MVDFNIDPTEGTEEVEATPDTETEAELDAEVKAEEEAEEAEAETNEGA